MTDAVRQLIGVGNGFRRPRPPNRACGSPAHGSPVGGFLIGIGSLTQGLAIMVNNPCARKSISYLPLMTPLTSAANMRSLHFEASTHDPSRAARLCALRSPFRHWQRFAFALPLGGISRYPPSCLPSLGAVLLPALFAAFGPLRYHEGSDSCTAHLPCRSPRLPRHTFLSFRLQPRGLPEHRLPPRQRVQRFSDFALESQARRSSSAESSSLDYGPTFRLRLLSTSLSQRRSYLRLRSLWLTPTRTFTVLM